MMTDDLATVSEGRRIGKVYLNPRRRRCSGVGRIMIAISKKIADWETGGPKLDGVVLFAKCH